MSGLEKLIETARGKRKADLVIKNANIINVLSEEIHKGDIAIVTELLPELVKITKARKKLMLKVHMLAPLLLMVMCIWKVLWCFRMNLPKLLSLAELQQL